ncbi:MAG TPA: hypothetical protein DDY91_21740 [Planctomycetaceae bacterium]|nr:hypothetical protein [Planctomycetaceae bacterium]
MCAKLQPVIDEFDALNLVVPGYEALLFDVTDDMGPDELELVENNDSYFQVLIGCDGQGTEEQLTQHVLAMLRRVIRMCQLSPKDLERVDLRFAPPASAGDGPGGAPQEEPSENAGRGHPSSEPGRTPIGTESGTST